MNGKIKDPVSCLTHLLGALLAVAGLILLLTRPSEQMSVTHYVSFALFGTSMVLLYSASALYHYFNLSERSTLIFRRIDHIMIFMLIAGTYTPICLLPLRGGWGWTLLVLVWTLALAGIVFKIFWLGAPRKLYTFIYLFLGWIIIIAIWPLWQALSLTALIWLFAGGLFYSAGAIIYALKRPDPWPGKFGFHEIFHILIMLGTFSQFWMIYKYL